MKYLLIHIFMLIMHERECKKKKELMYLLITLKMTETDLA